MSNQSLISYVFIHSVTSPAFVDQWNGAVKRQADVFDTYESKYAHADVKGRMGKSVWVTSKI